jgi:predicted  nucleic acid-binding Zn-ribbon protein
MGEKEIYKQKLQAQLEAWRAELDKLKARSKEIQADAQLDLHKQIDLLEEQVADANRKLNELADAGDEAWMSLKAGLEASWASLKRGFGEAAEKFRNT